MLSQTAQRKVRFLDLSVPQQERSELLEAINRVLEHGILINGPELTEFEKQIAKLCSRKFAVGVNSGTDAIFLALKALGIGPGDEVITTALSWIATANAIALTGATPVFADIGEDLNIAPESVESSITPRTKAILPVHYTGKMCDMVSLESIASKHGLKIVEDAAQAFGAHFHNKKAGSWGDIACFSMNPMKILAACGEAGIILTDDQETYEKLVSLRYNGTINKEVCIATSLNARLDTIQAAILLERLKTVESHIEVRRKIASKYIQHLAPYVTVPKENPFSRDIYYTFTIRTTRRDELKKYLEENDVEVKIQHPYLMCQQPVYQKCLKEPVLQAEKIVKEILCLPIHEKLSIDEQDYVIALIKAFFHESNQ